MTNEELVALIQAGDHVQDNMGLLYQQNREFIVKIALPYSKSVELEDLVQEAYFGLEKAVQRYDPTTGFKFLTYAEDCIRGTIQRYCQKNGNLKRLPVHILVDISKYQKFRSEFQSIVGSEPTDEEYCYYLGITTGQLKTLRKYMVGSEPVSLDGTIPGTEDLTLGDTLSDEFDLEEYVAEQQIREAVWGAVEALKDQQAEIIRGIFRNDETLDDLSRRLEISKERVRYVKNRALGLLRRNAELKEIAGMYGYGCAQAYYWSFGHYKNTGTSSTEFLALKRIEYEEECKRVSTGIQEISSLAALSSNRIRKIDRCIPVGLKKLNKLLADADALLKENERINKAKSKGV